MADPDGRGSAALPRPDRIRRALCCSFAASTRSPDRPHADRPRYHRRRPSKPPPKVPGPGSPSPSGRLGLGIIDPRRRILSPGRVSPIESVVPVDPLPEVADSASIASAVTEPDPELERPDPVPKETSLVSGTPEPQNVVCFNDRGLDLRLSLKGKDGRCLVLELDPGILCESSAFFASKLLDSRRKVSDSCADSRKVEVAGVENVDVFKETIELVYEKDAARWLMKAGASRAIDILEVSSTIMFDRGIKYCLKYIESVPWSESEEEKLKSLFARCKFDEAISEGILARLGPQCWDNAEDLALQLIQSVTNATNRKARKEMQSLVSGLLSRSSIYQKDPAGLDKEKLYYICRSCLNSLVQLFEEATSYGLMDQMVTRKETKPLIERVSRQVENLNWLLEILIEKEMAEDFVYLWANQEELVMMRRKASPMIRYELSRISSSVFIALGRGKLQCHGDDRLAVLSAWFEPMLMDFGWLQRCPKGLNMRMLEESLGQVLLTLRMKQQQCFFEEWFRHFAEHGNECPNLGKAFQIWWRRLFGRSSIACR